MSHSIAHGAGRDAVRAAGDGLSALGAALVLFGVWRALVVFEVLPAAAASWWPAVLIAVGGWLALRGRQGPATSLVAIGTSLLVIVTVPDDFVGPAVLITIGVLVILATLTGRRWLRDFPGIGGVALFGDRHVQFPPGLPTEPLVAVFGETTGELHGPTAEGDVISCLALFGSTKLTVPRDLDIEVRPMAVFGDVRTPGPPTGTVEGRVRATAVFGDVRIRRA